MILVLIVPAIAGAQDTGQRYELGGRITYTFLREIGTKDVGMDGIRRSRWQASVTRFSFGGPRN